MIEQSKTYGGRSHTIGNPKLVPDRDPGSKIMLVPPNVLARTGLFGDKQIKCSNGEAKFWLEPQIELAKNFRLSRSQIKEIEQIIEGHYDELKRA